MFGELKVSVCVCGICFAADALVTNILISIYNNTLAKAWAATEMESHDIVTAQMENKWAASCCILSCQRKYVQIFGIFYTTVFFLVHT